MLTLWESKNIPPERSVLVPSLREERGKQTAKKGVEVIIKG
jgi:hypothetical protein